MSSCATAKFLYSSVLTRIHSLAPLLLCLALVSCQHDRKHVIGVVPKAISHLFFMSVHAGVRDAERDLGVDVLWNGPQEETDYGRQIQIVDSMVARHVDALAISATDQHALVAPVQRAMQAGIPVTIFDSGLEVQNYVTFVATDNRGAGQTAARKLAELVHGTGQVAMLMHKPGGKSTVDRETGFDEVMAKEFPNIHVVARLFGMADRAKSRTAAENILTAHPDLDGMFASAEANSLGAVQALKARGLAGKIRLVTFDFSDAHVEALQDGTIDAMIVQDPYRMGYEAVRTLVDKLNGKTPPQRMDLTARIILKNDLNRPDVKALLFPAWRKPR